MVDDKTRVATSAGSGGDPCDKGCSLIKQGWRGQDQLRKERREGAKECLILCLVKNAQRRVQRVTVWCSKSRCLRRDSTIGFDKIGARGRRVEMNIDQRPRYEIIWSSYLIGMELRTWIDPALRLQLNGELEHAKKRGLGQERREKMGRGFRFRFLGPCLGQ